MAERAAHVTMLQRSPSYVLSLPAKDPIADFLRKVLPAKAAYPIVRWKNVGASSLLFQGSRRAPRVVKKIIRSQVERQLPDGYDVDTHFRPTYDPWDQRVCLVPNGDLFRAIRNGGASVVTDKIDTFTESGLRLASGQELEADVIVTATGLNLLVLGGLDISLDGRAVDLSQTVGYKGMMFSGVPNLAIVLGYTNASWTLKGDLVAEYVCRLINHMDAEGFRVVTPLAPAADARTEPFIDLQSGYVLRSIDRLPKQGPHAPWRLHQNYARDIVMMRRGSLEDGALELTGGP
jgi:cation diffusion facilitator CzcD-associated flavoprotein CzcO